MYKIAGSCLHFFRKEAVFSIAAALALVSAFFSPPSLEYIWYVDWDTLAMLFGLMAVMKGFQNAGLFALLGNALIRRTADSRRMLAVLVFLPFVFSMFITNDVALITFVPIGLAVLRMARLERCAVQLVVLQTVAANLGSMLLPMGNPQNLYLYTKSGMGFGELAGLMLPYAAISGACLLALVLAGKNTPVSRVSVEVRQGDKKDFLYYGACFALCLLGIFNVLPPVPIAAVIAVFTFFVDRHVLAEVDYSLLGTFAALFVFIGNIGCIDAFRGFISGLLSGHVELAAILASQVISNVPAAILLSGFTNQWEALIVGCNLGGLGTLIASMASLISYKSISNEYPELRKKYLLRFSAVNAGLLALLFAAGRLF